MKPRLYLIDGTALIYRAYYAFIKNPLINSRRENTSAIFGVVNSFLTLIDKMQAEYIAISFDRKAPTFRHIQYEAYKANRPPMPEDMQSQIQPIWDFFAAIGMPNIGQEGYEADDALGTMGARFKQDFEIVYVTSDKDYCQLLEPGSSLYDPMKDSSLNESGVYEKYQVKASQFIDYLALVGDSSDNIPGVKGIGPKAAVALLRDYSGIEEIYERLDEVEPKYQGKLRENRDNAFISKELATIVKDLDIPLPSVNELQFSPQRLVKGLPLLKHYEIMSLVRRIEAKYPALKQSAAPAEADFIQDDIFADSPALEAPKPPAPERKAEFTAITLDSASLPAFWKQLKSQSLVSLDCESDSLDPLSAALVGISLCFEPSTAYYLPLGHQMADNLPWDSTISALKDALQGKTILGHNLKYDLMLLERHKLKLDNPLFDTMLAAYILDAGGHAHSLSNCALKEYNYRMQEITELIGKGQKQITFDLVSVEDATFYAAEDAWMAYRLYQLYHKILANSSAAAVYYDIELPLLRVLKRMEENGVSIDTKILSGISQELNKELKQLSQAIYAAAGYEFNINSTQQLAKLLFNELKLPAKRKTKTGYSTDNSVLEELAENYPIADKLISYRSLMKLEGTYLSALPRLVNPATQRIHSSFNQAVASTGRLSSTNPNLQNIPIRTPIGREIRKAFIARDADSLILAADYSQIELRILALFSGDTILQKAFAEGLDIHRQTAAIIQQIPLEKVSPDMRRAAKAVNFGLLYGMGARKLARDLELPMAQAKELMQNYFERFPSIKRFTEECVAKARQNEQASTLFGRFLALPGIHSKNKGISSEAERVAINMPIQGTAADLIKIAMNRIHERIKNRSDILLILQVHDELVFEVKKAALDEAMELIRYEMENALPEKFQTQIQLGVDIGYGSSWYEAH